MFVFLVLVFRINWHGFITAVLISSMFSYHYDNMLRTLVHIDVELLSLDNAWR